MNTPIIVLPVPADDPSKSSPSDHSVPLSIPLQSTSDNIRRDMKTKWIRPMPQSKLETFQTWLSEVDRDCIISPDATPSAQVDAFQTLIHSKLDEIFPQILTKHRLQQN